MLLTKLLKYDMKAIGRILLPMYLILIVLSFIARLSLGDIGNLFNENAIFHNYLHIFNTILLCVYIFFIATVIITTFIVIIQRFYKNLLSDEGYLMNTLPVKTWQNILAKLLSAFVWNLCSFIASAASIIILIFNPRAFASFLENWSDVWMEMIYLNGNDINKINILIVSYTICLILQQFASILLVYSSMAIGQLANVHKKALSLAAFFGIYTVTSIISGQIGMIFIRKYSSAQGVTEGFMFEFLMTSVIVGIILNIITSAIYFFITNYLIEKKLNLE